MYACMVEGKTVALLESRIPGHPSIYHPDCEILIQSSGRCISCNKQRRSLAAMVSRPHTDDRTNPSSHTTYCNLTDAEKMRDYVAYNKIKKLIKVRLID